MTDEPLELIAVILAEVAKSAHAELYGLEVIVLRRLNKRLCVDRRANANTYLTALKKEFESDAKKASKI